MDVVAHPLQAVFQGGLGGYSIFVSSFRFHINIRRQEYKNTRIWRDFFTESIKRIRSIDLQYLIGMWEKRLISRLLIWLPPMEPATTPNLIEWWTTLSSLRLWCLAWQRWPWKDEACISSSKKSDNLWVAYTRSCLLRPPAASFWKVSCVQMTNELSGIEGICFHLVFPL